MSLADFHIRKLREQAVSKAIEETLARLGSGRCKNCEFWSAKETIDGMRRCSALDRYEPDNATDPGGPECEGIHTGPEFGCVHFKAKIVA